MQVKTFTFNDFYENTYILYDDTRECIIIDPGCSNALERENLSRFIKDNQLKPAHLINTHCHIDHILGNKFIADLYNLPLASHKGEQIVLDAGIMTAEMYSIRYDKSPDISIFLDDGDIISFGNTKLSVLLTPGHSPASISFYNAEDRILIAGDVLFEGSIGRTDLPGGDYNTLINSVKTKFFTLPDNTQVYPGHGNSTTIDHEKNSNPFF